MISKLYGENPAFEQLKSFINSDLKGDLEEAKSCLEGSVYQIETSAEQNKQNNNLKELLKFAQGTHPYYTETRDETEGFQLIFGDVHDDGFFAEVFTQFVQQIKRIIEKSLGQTKDDKDLKEMPVFHVFLEKDLAEAGPIGRYHEILNNTLVMKTRVHDSKRCEFMLHGLSSFSFEYAETDSFFEGLDNPRVRDIDHQHDCVRILSGNYNMICSIKNKLSQYKEKNYPFNFLLLCGEQHAGGIAELLGVDAIVPTRKELSSQDATKYNTKHDVYPIYARRKNCNDGLIIFGDESDEITEDFEDNAKTTNISDFTEKVLRHLNCQETLEEIIIDQLKKRNIVLEETTQNDESPFDEEFSVNNQEEIPEDPLELCSKSNSYTEYVSNAIRQSQILSNCALMLFQSGKITQTEKYLKQALYFLNLDNLITECELDPKEFAVVQVRPSDILKDEIKIETNIPTEAKLVILLEKSKSYYEVRIFVLYQYIQFLINRGRYPDALSEFTKLRSIQREINHDSHKILSSYIFLLHEMNKLDEAKEVIDTIQENNYDGDARASFRFIKYQNLRLRGDKKGAERLLFEINEPFDQTLAFLIQNDKVLLLLKDDNKIDEALNLYYLAKEHFKLSTNGSGDYSITKHELYRKIIKTGAVLIYRFHVTKQKILKLELSWQLDNILEFIGLLSGNEDRREATKIFIDILIVYAIVYISIRCKLRKRLA